MSLLADLTVRGVRVAEHRPWPRVTVDASTWSAAVEGLAAGELTLVGLWGDGEAVHMALADWEGADIAVVSLAATAGRFPSVGRAHPPAIRLERAISDLYGLQPTGALDDRPWLDHGRWGVRHPLGQAEVTAPAALPYAFLPVEGESLHQIPVGPVHAGIIEPGHFRFTANGETVVRLEERLGYVHKGIDGLMRGADLARAARLAGRTSGDSTVAYALAFSRAVEAALQIEAPPRAHHLRAVMAELERLANHFGDIGAICNDATFPLMLAQCGILREKVLRASDFSFGHRLMMDRIVPGGVAADLSPEGETALRTLVAETRKVFPRLVELYDNTASLQDRTVATGILSAALASQFGVGGYVGRASGRSYDARRTPGYPPLRRHRIRRAGRAAGRRQCARLGPHAGSHRKPLADRNSAGPAAGWTDRRRASSAERRGGRRRSSRRRLPRRHSRLGPARRRWHGRVLPPARSVLVPVAAS